MVGWYHRLMDMSLSKLREIVKSWETGHAAVQRVTKSQTRLKRLNSNMGPIPLALSVEFSVCREMEGICLHFSAHAHMRLYVCVSLMLSVSYGFWASPWSPISVLIFLSRKAPWSRGRTHVYSLSAPEKRKCWRGVHGGARELPGDPVVRTLYSHCRGHGFNPWSGN